MNRIDTILNKLQVDGKKMLSPYITAGDPAPNLTVDIMHALVSAGADILELGIPFSDPMAEGPVIQHAMERALKHNIHCLDVLTMVKEFRKKDKLTAVILMSYVNPVEQYGYDSFAQQAQESGVDGTILVDLPPEEASGIAKIWQKYNLYSIYLCSPTTSEERMTRINQSAQGYLYYVSLKGVSGADSLDIKTLKTQYEHKKAQTKLPLMVGFGIKTGKMAAQVASFADGVIVGAALVHQLSEAYLNKQDPLKAGAALINTMRLAIDNHGKIE
ncbi:MAG: tryptophan synthase subunit alpha [Legionella sp.]|nr:tryptophan synthase subunit alpha [Legionella sp.]